MMTPMPYADPEKAKESARERQRRWRENNPEAAKAAQDKFRATHPEKIRAATAAWKSANPAAVALAEKRRTQDPEWRAKKAAAVRAYTKRHPDRIRDAKYKKQYGITLGQYNKLLEVQGGRCSICDTPAKEKRLAVDHCHDSKKIRGLLCANCNNGLGRFKHDRKFLERAMFYLTEPSPLA